MTSKEVRARIEETGIVAAIRVYSAEEALFAAEAVVAGWNSRRRNHFNRASSHQGHCPIGEEKSPNRGGGRRCDGHCTGAPVSRRGSPDS